MILLPLSCDLGQGQSVVISRDQDLLHTMGKMDQELGHERAVIGLAGFRSNVDQSKSASVQITEVFLSLRSRELARIPRSIDGSIPPAQTPVATQGTSSNLWAGSLNGWVRTLQ